MPAKRKTRSKKAAPKKEEVVVEQTVAEPEPVVEKTPAEPETVVEETEPVAVEETTEPEKPNDEEMKEDTKEDVEAEDEDNEEMSVVPEIKKPKKSQKTIEEKIAELDGLSKAHPVALALSLSKECNKLSPYFKVQIINPKNETVKSANKDEKEAEKEEENKEDKKETEEDGKEDSKEEKEKESEQPKKKAKFMSATCQYGTLKMTIPFIEGTNIKFANKTAADLLLKHFYSEEHELDETTEKVQEANLQEDGVTSNIKIELDDEETKERYEKKKEAHEKFLSENVDRMIKSTEKHTVFSEEEKKERIARFEKYRKTVEDKLPSYDDIYKDYDNIYFRVLNNCLNSIPHLGYKVDIKRIDEDGTETQVDFKKTNKENEKNAEDQYKVTIEIKRQAKVLFTVDSTSTTNSIREAKSESAYLALEKMLRDDIISFVSRKMLINQNRDFDNNSFRNGSRSRGGNHNFGGRGGFSSRPGGMPWGHTGRGGSRGGRGHGGFGRGGMKRGHSGHARNSGNIMQQNAYMHNQMMMQNQMMMNNQMMMQNSMMPPQGGNPGQIMMMPCMMGPNGQMMMMGGPQMMGGGMAMPQNSAPIKKKRGNNKK